MSSLLVMRHAKSDWDAQYGSDHDRPLNDRGVRSAKLMGRLLASEGLVPDLVISSTAVRARTTAELAIEAGAWTSQLTHEPLLYGGGVEGALTVIATAPAVDSLMVVGHQPTWSMLVAELTGSIAEMKTATVAVIDRASGTLNRVLQPRDYFGTAHDG